MKIDIDLNSDKSPIISFGKHKGKRLSQVPLRYIAWLLVKYEGSSLSRGEIEEEAISRGCEKRDGKWGIRKKQYKYPGGFDVNGIGYGTMAGVVETLRDDWENATCEEEIYEYEGIPNT